MMPDLSVLPSMPGDDRFVTPLADYGEGQPQQDYRQQDKRVKTVDATCPPAFVHGRETHGPCAGDPLVLLWFLEGRRILREILSNAATQADPAELHFLLQLLRQQKNAAVHPLSEQDAVKISNAHLFRLVEELPHRYPASSGVSDKYELRSLAEHTLQLVELGGELKSKKLEKGVPLEYKGTASVRADNLFAIAAVGTEARDQTTPRFTAILEFKPLGEVPISILEKELETFESDYLRHLSLGLRPVAQSRREKVIASWEKKWLRYYKKWGEVGTPGPLVVPGGLLNTKATNFAGQLASYTIGYNTPYVIGSSYSGLVLCHFHRGLRFERFEQRWNHGLGAGGCAKMAVLSYKNSKFFLATIVGFMSQAIRESIGLLDEDMGMDDEDIDVDLNSYVNGLR